MVEKSNNNKVLVEPEPYSMFLFAIRSAKTKEKLIGRLEMFLNFIGLTKDSGSIEDRCKSLIQKINENKKDETNNNWLLHKIISYLQYQKGRVERNEITAGTLKNYYNAVKLFWEMNDISFPWKKKYASMNQHIFKLNQHQQY